MKINNDKYYTPLPLAKKLISKTFEIIEGVTEIIEPSAGNGSFSLQIPNCIAYDIAPEHSTITKADFLSLPLSYKKGRLFIGNPPFGNRNTLSVKFFKKCIECGDYIAFIQPISQINNNAQMYQFDLIYSEDLGIVEYSGRKLHCCFNIYRRPKNGLNPKPNFKLKDVTIKEYRRGSSSIPPQGYDFAICNWGNSSLGKQSEYIGQYAQEVYFYCKPEFLTDIRSLMEYETIRAYVKSISAKKISVSSLYKYIKDNIERIE